MDFLTHLNLFETASFSSNDQARTKQYQEEAGRIAEQKSFLNEDEFLQSLKMVAEVQPFNKFNGPRVAQLSMRSNQFNLRTVRYTEEDVQRLSQSKSHITLAISLKDKFGDSGLIAVVVLEIRKEELFIENWMMSCRVLKRGMENFTLNTIVQSAMEHHCEAIRGEYIPTPKNGMVKDHYENLGFEKDGAHWKLNVKEYVPKKCFIELN
jgi:FkbH-like protein